MPHFVLGGRGRGRAVQLTFVFRLSVQGRPNPHLPPISARAMRALVVDRRPQSAQPCAQFTTSSLLSLRLASWSAGFPTPVEKRVFSGSEDVGWPPSLADKASFPFRGCFRRCEFSLLVGRRTEVGAAADATGALVSGRCLRGGGGGGGVCDVCAAVVLSGGCGGGGNVSLLCGPRRGFCEGALASTAHPISLGRDLPRFNALDCVGVAALHAYVPPLPFSSFSIVCWCRVRQANGPRAVAQQ